MPVVAVMPVLGLYGASVGVVVDVYECRSDLLDLQTHLAPSQLCGPSDVLSQRTRTLEYGCRRKDPIEHRYCAQSHTRGLGSSSETPIGGELASGALMRPASHPSRCELALASPLCRDRTF